MTIATIALGAAVLALILALARTRLAARRHAGEASERAEEARAALRNAEQRASANEERVDELTRRLAEVPAPPQPDTAGPTARNPLDVLEALWGLSSLERARAQRDNEVLSTAPAHPSPSRGLEASIDDEVSRLREEAGTPGSVRFSLDSEPAAGDSELLLRSVKALLATLSRHCQAYELLVHERGERLIAVVVCDAFDGPDSVADDTAEVLAALQPVDGHLELDRDGEGRLRASLSVPAGSLESRL